MPKITLGILLGAIAGLIDIIPMIIQKLSWDKVLSAFSHFVIVGLIISISNIQISGIVKGLLIALILLIPVAFLVWWNDKSSIAPMIVSTIVLGSLLGFLIDKYGK